MGKLKGPLIDATVKILEPGVEDQQARIAMKYDTKFSWKFFRFVNKLRFWKELDERVFLEVVTR